MIWPTFVDAWTAAIRAFWKRWLDEPPFEPPPHDGGRRSAEDLHREFRRHIEHQERIRCEIDEGIRHIRSLDEDIVAVVHEMIRRRNENPPPE